MKNVILLALFVFIALWGNLAQAYNFPRFDKVIYGVDNRKEVVDSPSNYADWAASTAAMIQKSLFSQVGSEFQLGTIRTLGEAQRLCPSERFRDQISPANCSGFLIAPDVLVTAGHCITTTVDCSKYYWVFDFKVDENDIAPKSFAASQVYSCKEIITRDLNRTTKNDYAVIRLDRSTGRKGLEYRKSGKVANDADLVVIGHPSGLPAKVTELGTMRVNSDPVFFVANLDTYAGNSGSVVIDSKSGLVEGILVRGATDYVPSGSCYISNVCQEGQCRGEDVTRMTSVPSLSLKKRK